MSNLSLGIIYLLFTVLGLPVFILSILRRQEREASFFFILLCTSNAFWGIANALFYLLPNESVALQLYEIRYVFICYSSIFTYLFTLQDLKRTRPSVKSFLILCCIPLITLAAVLTDNWYGLMHTSIEIVTLAGIRTVVSQSGPWFWFHCIICYTCLFLAMQLIIRQCLRLPRNYRLPVTVMLSGILITFLVTLAAVLDFLPLLTDPTLIVVQVSQIAFFYVMYHSHSFDMIFTSRDVIFENANHAMFILDTDQRIMDYNHYARDMGREVGISELYYIPYQHLINQWLETLSARTFEEDDSIFTIHQEGSDSHYQIIQSDLLSQKNKMLGTTIEIKNVTPIMSLIHKLQDSAYYDQLTGLHNRRSFAVKLQDLNLAEYLPLGIMVGDINRLKLVNDTYGHTMGDLLLQTVTKTLLHHSPATMLWFRIGGDEFVGLLPHATVQDLEQLQQDVWAACAAFSEPRFLQADIALAYRIKANSEQDIHLLFEEADQAMYANKRDRRRKTQER